MFCRPGLQNEEDFWELCFAGSREEIQACGQWDAGGGLHPSASLLSMRAAFPLCPGHGPGFRAREAGAESTGNSQVLAGAWLAAGRVWEARGDPVNGASPSCGHSTAPVQAGCLLRYGSICSVL